MRSIGIRAFFTAGVALAALAQAPPQMRALHLPGADRVFDLPLIVCPRKPEAAMRINADLQLIYLDGLVKPGDKDPLSALKQAASAPIPDGSLLTCTFTSQSTHRLIGVTIRDSSQTGAYPNYGIENHLYDAIHGQPVTLTDLFTPEGLLRFKGRLGDLRRAALKALFQSEAIAAAKGDAEAAAALDVQKSAASKEVLVNLGQLWREDDLALSGSKVIVPGPRLGLNHVAMQYEPEWGVALVPRDLVADLTPYGRSLLGSGKMVPLPSAWSRRVFTGTIGTARVVLSLTREKSIGVRCLYAYLKYRSTITLDGVEDRPGHFRFDEWLGPGSSNPAILQFQCDGWKLEGTWASPDGKRMLPFQASAK